MAWGRFGAFFLIVLAIINGGLLIVLIPFAIVASLEICRARIRQRAKRECLYTRAPTHGAGTSEGAAKDSSQSRVLFHPPHESGPQPGVHGGRPWNSQGDSPFRP